MIKQTSGGLVIQSTPAVMAAARQRYIAGISTHQTSRMAVKYQWISVTHRNSLFTSTLPNILYILVGNYKIECCKIFGIYEL